MSLRARLQALFGGRVNVDEIRLHIQNISRNNSFTIGKDVYLSSNITANQLGETLAHEITHTIQQSILGFMGFMARYFGMAGAEGPPIAGEYGRPGNYSPLTPGGEWSPQWQALQRIPINQLNVVHTGFTLDLIADRFMQVFLYGEH